MTSTAGSGSHRLVGAPYVGPRPYQSTEADRFFGREAESHEAAELWRSRRVVVVYGRLGVGKTSLLNAGVVPLITSRPDVDVLPVGNLIFGSAASARFARSASAHRQALLGSWAPFAERADLDIGISEFLVARATIAAAASKPRVLLAAIDQLEALFVGSPEYAGATERVIDELTEGLRAIDALHLLLVVREDHLATFQHYQGRFAEFHPAYLRLDALGIAAAVDAVSAPLAAEHRSFGPGVAERLVDRLRTFRFAERLPLETTIKNDLVEPLDLQIACASMWAALPDDIRVISDENAAAFADPAQAVGDFYDAAVRDVHQWVQHVHICEQDLREWVEDTFITEFGTRGIALRGITTTAHMPNAIADAFVELRILAPEYRSHSTWYQLGQDRLIDAVRRANAAWRALHGVPETDRRRSRGATDFRAGAESAFLSGDFDAAQRLVASAIDGFREASDTRHVALSLELQGEISRSQGDLAAAECSFNDALFQFSVLEDAPAQARLLSALGDIQATRGDFVRAVQLHKQAYERLPTDVTTLTGLGYAQWRWGSPADAEATFTKALDWNCDQGQALAGRGQVRVELRDYLAALADLDRAITLGLPLDDEIDARAARAVALADLGRGQEAARELRAARVADPGRPRTRLRAARVEVACGRSDRARDELLLALQAIPPMPPGDHEPARRLLAEISGT